VGNLEFLRSGRLGAQVMTASAHSSLIEKVKVAMRATGCDCTEWHDDPLTEIAQAAISACHVEEMLEVLRWYASQEAYGTEGFPEDTVYDRMRRKERVLIDRGQRARAVLDKLDGKP
jgi:hypothetical protein